MSGFSKIFSSYYLLYICALKKHTTSLIYGKIVFMGTYCCL